jgi:hypothetical protein
MRRRMMGVVVATAAAVAVALQWLPAEPGVSQAARASTPIEITLALRASGPAIEVEHGGLTLTLQF